MRKEDGITPTDPFDRGAGRVNIARRAERGPAVEHHRGHGTRGQPGHRRRSQDAELASWPMMPVTDVRLDPHRKNPTGTKMNWNGEFVGQDGLQATLTTDDPNLAAGAGDLLLTAMTSPN